MSEEMQKKIFSKNLNYFMSLNDKTQTDLIEDLGFNKSTVSTWCNGTKMPRMGTIQTLADYFGVKKSDLIDERSEQQESGYYINDDAKELAQFLYDNPEYKVLFDASRKVRKEDIEFVRQMIDRLKNNQ